MIRFRFLYAVQVCMGTGRVGDLGTSLKKSKFYIFNVLSYSVSDPYSFFPDPDPEVEAGDQYGSGSGSMALMTKKLKKNNS
jgi:hypothetical protein